MSELRWVLLLIGLVFLAALTLWERRRPRQASPSATPERHAARELPERSAREPMLTLPEIRAVPPTLPTVQLEEPEAAPRLTSAPERPPAAQQLAPADLVQDADPDEGWDEDPDVEPDEDDEMEAPEASAARTPAPVDGGAQAGPAELSAPPAVRPGAAREALPELPAHEPLVVEWPPDEQRRILSLRLVAPQPQRFPGRSLRQALAAEGFVLGRFAIFHKPDEARRAVLSAASLNRPGTFDADTMDSQHYGGLSLFAVLPGPKAPPQAFDELVFTARNLNDRLHGVLQDEQGGPLTPARIATLRERLSAKVTS
jgi:cell division protein ZipA